MFSYYSVIQGSKMQTKYNLRLEMVMFAKKQGIKPASLAYKTTKKTVRKWLDRYSREGLNGLKDRSRAPNRRWKKCPDSFEDRVVKLRNLTKNKFGAIKLKDRYSLKWSASCINRIIKQHPELRRKKKTITDKRNELWSVKKLTKAFEVIQVDVKHLMDISNYYPLQWKYKLPKYEITARCVKTGATWLCLSDTKEAISAASFISMLLQHLKGHGFDVKTIRLQMDNGTEFFNINAPWVQSKVEQVMEYFEVKHNRIPPAAPTFNSDVETFHRLVEDEFYSIEQFISEKDMSQQLYTHMLDFNYIRKNSYKDNKTPLALLKEDYPDCNDNVLNFPILNICNHFHFYSDLFQKREDYNTSDQLIDMLMNNYSHQGGYHVSTLHIRGFK